MNFLNRVNKIIKDINKNMFILLLLIFSFKLQAQTRFQLNVKEMSGFDRTNEIIQNGIPLNRSLNFSDTNNLKILDSVGTQIPAQFEVLSRWAGAKTGSTPIQWLLVSFPASLTKNSTKKFYLTTGANSTPTNPISITSNSTEISVSTGIARFVISKTSFSVFKGAYLIGAGGAETQCINDGGRSEIKVDDTINTVASAPELITIERNGLISATIKVMGHYNQNVKGGKKLKYTARYKFFSNSRDVQIDFDFCWPSNELGQAGHQIDQIFIGYTNRTDRMLFMNKVRLSMPLMLTGTISGYVGADSANELTHTITSGQTASLNQKRRPTMASPASYVALIGTDSLTGTFATRPLVAAYGSTGGVGGSIQQMRYYEPQKIIVSPESLSIEIVSEPQRLAGFQGAFAKVNISLIPPSSNMDTLRKQIVSHLDCPLIAWPPPASVSASKVLGELGNSIPSNSYYNNYLANITKLSDTTLAAYERFGMHGFMTYGFTVDIMRDGEKDFGDGLSWDSYYMQGQFSDYHHSLSNPFILFAMTNNPTYLYRLTIPAARRTLHTSAIQIDSGTGFFGGTASTGYETYRANPNSSHNYFDNLFYYYYLTGDKGVTDMLQFAGETQRHFYSRNSDGSLVSSDLPPINDWMETVGRVGSQYAAIQYFLSHTLDDYSFFYDCKNRWDRLVSRNLVLVNKNSKEYGFIGIDEVSASPGTLVTEQIWMLAIYPLNDIWKIYLEYGDLKLGSDSIPISRLFKAVNLSWWDYSATTYPGGNGTASGEWTNMDTITYTGNHIGGTLDTVVAVRGSDDHLYQTSKAPLISVMFRSANIGTPDTAMTTKALSMYNNVFSSPVPNNFWDKENGLYFSRTHAALYYIGLKTNTKIKTTLNGVHTIHFKGNQ